VDLALLLIAAKAFLRREGTPPPTGLPPTSQAEVPRCGPNEKLTYIPSQDKYVCLPDEGFD